MAATEEKVGFNQVLALAQIEILSKWIWVNVHAFTSTEARRVEIGCGSL